MSITEASANCSANGSDQTMLDCCGDCASTVITYGPLDKRTGFCCCDCQKPLHFKCKGLTTYKNGLLANAVISFFDSDFVKSAIESMLICGECMPTSLSNEPKENGDDLSAVDLEARASLAKLETANKEITTKLDFLVSFLVPSEAPMDVADHGSEAAAPSYADVAKVGSSGLQSIVRTACVEAQKQVTERDRMKRTVIIDGVPEGRTEGEDALQLMKALGMPTFPIAEAHRLGQRKGPRPRKLKIVCNSETDQRFLLGSQVQDVLHSSSFPLRNVYLNPSRSSEERRHFFLLRQRRNLLNKNLATEDAYFLHRHDGRLVKKVDGRPDWGWIDSDFEEWVADFEKQAKLRMSKRDEAPVRGRVSMGRQAEGDAASSEWNTVGRGQKVLKGRRQGNRLGGMGWQGL